MKVTITIEAGSATIANVLEDVAREFDRGSFDEVDGPTSSVRSTINYTLNDGNEDDPQDVGKIIVKNSTKSRTLKKLKEKR